MWSQFNHSLTMKCLNRECTNLFSNRKTLYCSKKCQNREQNLRQGRVRGRETNKSKKQKKVHEESENDVISEELFSELAKISQMLEGKLNSPLPELDDKEKPTSKSRDPYSIEFLLNDVNN